MAARRVSAWLRRRFPASGASTVFYSYWCATGATALAMLREIEPERVAVARAHGVDLYPEQSSPPYLPLQAQTISRLDRLFVVSRHGVDYLRREYPDLASRLVFSPMGVRAARRLSRASPAGVFRVVSCSYITPIKRLGLIAAALRLSKTPIEWVHIGDGEGRAELEALVASLSPPARARLLGQLCNREVLDFYEREAVDLFLNVSESEGRPVSIMEALAHGIPVLATAVGGTPELVGADSGLLLPVTVTPADLAARLDALSRESRGLVHLREAAVEAWRRSADADRNYPEFAGWLESLAGPQTSSAPASSRPTTRSRPGLLLPRTERMDP